MNNFDLIAKLNMLEYFILNNAYIEDWDGDDEEGHPIIRKVFKGLEENEIKSLLEKISAIIQLVKEENYD